ncbi:conserved hypothetical protein [Candidatus Desulfarcum epimagneticum]|uniref:Arginine dihydrolase ArgZ/ArgE-like C-terminal second subdomain domain-containing protein n=1 Tax=uncultured Desulfobacteraceae bacterium TaxID=218296 RepID=A0A484HIE2_9BACT|nr:conserved hypothetical protein [uncultured Desulfobacteraceae bacterium]
MFKEFDTSELDIIPLSKRKHNLDLSIIKSLEVKKNVDPKFFSVAQNIQESKKRGASVVLMMGAHVLRSGVQRYLIDLMENGYISCLAVNGACIIHDFEFALIGKTTESVEKYITQGRFGLWEEVGRINDIISFGAANKMGAGEAIGKTIAENPFPHREISVFAAAYKLKIPITVHVGIGYDIVYEHPNCDGAAWGQTSYTDFLRFAHVLSNLGGGVVMNFGSAVMGPEVYLKALAMARNVKKRDGQKISNFTTLVCDLKPLPENCHLEPSKESPDYYFRPWKTMLARTISDGGRSYYAQASHAESIPGIWNALNT